MKWSAWYSGHIKSYANVRTHHMALARIKRKQRADAYAVTRHAMNGYVPHQRVVVRLTRYGRKLLDSDNLAYAFKALRDGVADALGRDDGAESLRWEYGQVARNGGAGAVIDIEELAANAPPLRSETGV